MKILVLHQYFLGPGEPGGSRFNEFAKEWTLSGHQVTIVAGSLNYATGVVPPHLEGKWNWRGTESGIDVWRCLVPGTYNKSYAGRMWAFFAFTLSSMTAMLRTGRPDVIVATSPPLMAGPVGWLAAKKHRVPWVFEIRDLWPESAITTGVISERSVLARLLFAMERFSCRTADRVNVLTPAFEESIVGRGLVAKSKVTFVPNGADLERFKPGPRQNAVRETYRWGHRFVALYAGVHGRANALTQLVDAAEALRQREDILIVTVGTGPEWQRLVELAERRGLKNIQFLGVKPKDEMPAFLEACDAGVAVLQKNPTFLTVYPNKVFDYMACERPTILAIDGVARDLVCNRAKAGVFAEPENGQAIAAAIEYLADHPDECRDMGTRARTWVRENASRQGLAARYLAILSGLIAR